jgi:hypothetical protein
MIVLRLPRKVRNVRSWMVPLLAVVAGLSACNPSSSGRDSEKRSAAEGRVPTADEQLRNEQFQAYAAQSKSDRRDAQADGERAVAQREKELQDEGQ